MRQSNGCPSNLKTSHWLSLTLVLCLALVSPFASAQQQSPSGAVEAFEPALNVFVAQRPRAGLYGITELMMAALEADIPKAKKLIDAGADVNETDDSQSTPLMWAVHSGDTDIVRFFISQGADIHAKANQGATAAINAVSGKHEEIAILLIDAGADANGRGNSHQNFLESAAASGMVGVVEALVRNGTNLATYGSSALLYAVSRAHKDTVVALLDAGVDVNSNVTRSQNSILHSASATGNLAIVKLMLSRGAQVSQTGDHRSPLYPAVARGHTEVVELLIANGAVVSAQFVLTATQNGFAETALALLHHLDVEVLDRNEIESLLAAAKEPGNEQFAELLLANPSAKKISDEAKRSVERERLAAKREHSRLLFAREIEEHCVIGIWDSRTSDSAALANIAKCPDTIFLSQDSHSAFVVDDTAIRIISMDGSSDSSNVPLPNLDYRSWIPQMTVRPDQNPDYQPSNTQMKPIGAGHFEDGSVGLLATVWMPADDEYHYLLRHDAGQWSIVEERQCSRWGCEKSLDALAFNSTNVWTWPESRMVWHPNISLNPFVAEQRIDLTDLQYESYQAATHHRSFEIGGVSTVLTAYTSPSEHSDSTHTFGIELTIGGQPPMNLSANQCLTSIVGRYILVYEFFRGRFEVTDISTGETVIGNLKAAMWLE